MKPFLAVGLLSLCFAIASGQQAEPATFEVKKIPDLTFAEPDGVELMLYLHLPQGVENPPLVMAIHGGSWKTGDRKRFKLDWLPKHGYAVANIEYRMSDEAVFPAQIHDCKGALRWLRAHQKEYGYNADKVAVVGYSAGGYLAVLMGTTDGVKALQGTTAGHLDQSCTVQAVVDYYGPVDFVQRSKSQPDKTEQSKGIVYQLLGGSVGEDLVRAKLASPVTHVGPGDPPILIIHGAKDPQVLPAQSERLHEVYQAKGLDSQLRIIPGKKHAWNKAELEEQQWVLEFLQKRLK